MKKAIIIGATSGIGQEVARILVQQGWRIGIAGRREDVLLHMQQAVPGQIEIQCLDVTKNDAALRLNELIDRLGGMDLFLLSSGVGFQNRSLEPEIELNTARTNVEGFIRMVTTAFHHFKKTGGGHIAVISSIAGTKGLGVAPAYSPSGFRTPTSTHWRNCPGCKDSISVSPTSARDLWQQICCETESTQC